MKLQVDKSTVQSGTFVKTWFQIGLILKAENCRNVGALDEDRGRVPRNSRDALATRMYTLWGGGWGWDLCFCTLT